MKLIFLAAFLASVLILSGANRCYSRYDCQEGTCCAGGITPYIRGSCQDLAEEGEKCDPNPPDTEKYFLYCPCVEGLHCVSESVQEGDAVTMKAPTCKRP
uniref:U15-Liphistoxin-Lsp1a_1 n=1 Tax=Liphistius sp. SGP-2016 TaxID=1905180 RepID=A0A4Q8K1F3_9ARAC